MDSTTFWIIVGAVAAGVFVLLAAAVFIARRSRRRAQLRREFGSEYNRMLQRANGREAAEAELRERQRRVDGYELRPLSEEEAAAFTLRWRQVQALFVDGPGDAVERADQLVAEVFVARGYRSSTTRERIDDLSVGHGEEAESYRLARASALRNRSGAATTEELRQAMLHFDRVFRAAMVTEIAAAPVPAAKEAA